MPNTKLDPTSLILNSIWNIRLKFCCEADKLHAEGNKLYAEASTLLAKSPTLHAEANKLRSQTHKLHTEAYKLLAEGNNLWSKTIFNIYGNVDIIWKNFNCCEVQNITYNNFTEIQKIKDNYKLIKSINKLGYDVNYDDLINHILNLSDDCQK